MHEIWLPAEKIVLTNGRVYYGYALATSDGWFTVLETNRTIVYLRADDLASRSVCQPVTSPQSGQYPPLIPILYTKPTPTPACADNPRRTSVTPVRLGKTHGSGRVSARVPLHAPQIDSVVKSPRLTGLGDHVAVPPGLSVTP